MESQKFVQIHRRTELHITACAVSKLAGIHDLPSLESYKKYFTEMNKPYRDWLAEVEKAVECGLTVPDLPDRAWVKIYRQIDPDVDSAFAVGPAQIVRIEMPFFGENEKECWGELQLNIKRAVERDGRKIELKPVQLGRHRSFDTRRGEGGEWVENTSTIEPKRDTLGTHCYVTLRLYHEDHLPKAPGDWRFEPLYISVGSSDFYRVDAVWQDEEIVITATLIDGGAPEIPKFLRR